VTVCPEWRRRAAETEIRNPKSEPRNPKLDTRNPKAFRRGAAKKAAEEMLAEQAHQEFHLWAQHRSSP